MDALDDVILTSLLRTDASGKVLQPEDDKVEFKEIFDNTSKEAKAKYVKEMAALYNYQGGYLIFGVSDTTLELVGLRSFTPPDNAELVNDLGAYFSPAIRFQTRVFTVVGKAVFAIYVEKRSSIPTICIKSFPGVLSESSIYWRYSAQSSPIRPVDLITLLHQLKGEDTKELAEIAKKEFRSKLKPHLGQPTFSYGGQSPAFTLTIRNHGELCYITSLESIDGDTVYLHQINKPQLVLAGREYRIEGHVNSGRFRESRFVIRIGIEDKEGYKYRQHILVSNGSAEFTELEDL